MTDDTSPQEFPYFPASTSPPRPEPPPAATSPAVTIAMRSDGTQYSYAKFPWTGAAELAVNLIVEGTHGLKEIAEQCHVSVQAIYAWRQHPDFKQRVEEYRAKYSEAVFELGISRVETRVAAQHDRWIRMQRLIEARGQDIEMAAVAGGNTGLLTRYQKVLGSGEDARIVDVFEFDAALVRELRELEKEASVQMGQRLERKQTEIVWDGDWSKLTGEQRTRLVGTLEEIAYGGDVEAIKAARLEAGVFEAETPETGAQEPV